MAVLVRKAVGAGAYASGRPLLPGLALAGAVGAAAAATHALPIASPWIQLACGTALTLAFCFLLVLSVPHWLDGADPALRRSLASRLPLPSALRARMER
jgi:hypothetical protein